MSIYVNFIRRSWAPRLTIIFIILQMIFIWHIDVSLGAIWRGNILTNGFAEYDPLQIYHISLYGVIIVTGLLGILGLRKQKHLETDQPNSK